MLTIEQLLISKGELERIYTGISSLYLWRAVHKSSITSNPLYPDFENREIRPGITRPADIKTREIGGIIHVEAKLGKGVSLFDRVNVFGSGRWTYFEIPKGTVIPSGLIITKDGFNLEFNATHYTISPNYTMPKKKFIELLDRLAKNARLRQEELRNSG